MTKLEKVIDSRWFKYTVLALWIAIVLLCLLNMDNITAETIIEFSPKNKFAAAALMMLLFALKSLSVVVYSGILFAALGLMFEMPAAILLAYLGSAICVTIPYFIGRTLGSRYVSKLEVKYPKLKKVQNIRVSNDFIHVMLIRFIGYIPFDVASLYLGTIRVPYRRYLPACLVGMSSLMIPMTVLGSTLDDPTSPAFIISLSVHLTLTALCTLYIIYNTKKNIEKSKGL